MIRSTLPYSATTSTRNVLREIVVDHLDAGIIDGSDNIGRRINADHGSDPLIGKRTEQHAVIAAEFKHRGFSRVQESSCDLGGIVGEMLAQGTDRGRKIEIILEQQIGRNFVGHLHGVAIPAKLQPHRERPLGSELLGLEERPGQPDLAEIHHQPQPLAVAERAHRLF